MQCVSARVPGRKSVGGVRRHPPAALDLLRVDRARPLGRRVVAHPGERPGEVDGGRPRAREDALGLVEVVSAQRREREPVRGRDPDRGRAAHDHRPDRVGHLRRRRAANVDDLLRQPALVEENDRGRRPRGEGSARARARLRPKPCLGAAPDRPQGWQARIAHARRALAHGRSGPAVSYWTCPKGQVPSSHEARYFACSSVSWSISTPIVASLRRAISSSISARHRVDLALERRRVLHGVLGRERLVREGHVHHDRRMALGGARC